jgi:hypothetical protein
MAGQTLQYSVRFEGHGCSFYLKPAAEAIIGDEKQSLQPCSDPSHN